MRDVGRWAAGKNPTIRATVLRIREGLRGPPVSVSGEHHLLICARRPAEGEVGEPSWPGVTEELALRLEPGEVVRWRGQVDVLGEARALADGGSDDVRVWSLQDVSDFVVTDRRLLYAGQGLTVNRTGRGRRLTAGVRKAYGSLPEGGRILAGQVRFEWPADIFAQAASVPWPGAVIVLTCMDGDVPVRLLVGWLRGIGGPSAEQRAASFARALAGDIARFRLLGAPSRLGPAETRRLRALCDQPGPEGAQPGLHLELPGGVPVGSVDPERRVAEPATPPPRAAAESRTPAPSTDPGREPRPRIGLLERVGVVALCGVLLLGIWTVGGLRSTSAAAGELERARQAFRRGDARGVVRAGDSVLRTAPRSLPALVLNSCATWDIRYTDEAVLYYQRALMAGLPWDRLVVRRPCFLNAPTFHGLRMARIASMPMLYAAPRGRTASGAALEVMATGDARTTPGESLLAAACLNDRSDLRLLAAAQLTMALNGPALPQATGALRGCLQSLRGRYVFETRDRQEIFWPKDLGDRRFLPDSSPIPGRRPRRLP